MARIAWENRDELPYAWRILRKGVCDGCALGTSGLSDWTLPGTHLCMVRLELMRLNTAPALDPAVLADAAGLSPLSSRQLRELGRLPHPMLRSSGEAGFHCISWEEALTRIAGELRSIDPRRLAMYLTSRGLTNEVYYAAQKFARFMGTNHVDNAARMCHAASTVAMKEMLGHGASTCSYTDWLRADLIVLFGSNVPNNQPVTTKYLYHAKKNGARIAVVNPHREPGLERYWIPSIPGSALSGTALADDWFDVHTGGDCAFLIGVLRALIELGGIDERFVSARTTGFDEARARAIAASVGSPRTRERCTARAYRELRASADVEAEHDIRLVDGSDPARAWGRHGPRPHQRRSRAGTAWRRKSRPRADSRTFGRSGGRRGRLRSEDRSAHGEDCGKGCGDFVCP